MSQFLQFQIKSWLQDVVIPEGCLTISDDFGVQEISAKKLQIGYYFGGYISEIKNPSNFFIQLKSTEDQLNDLMDDLQDFYSDKILGLKYAIKKVGPGLLGLPVAAIYFDSKSKVNHGWHRGIVRKILGVQEVNIFYCDYGSTADVYLPYVRFLPKRFGTPNAQAIRVRLGGIIPKKTTGSGKEWSSSAIQRFSGLVSYIFISANYKLVILHSNFSFRAKTFLKAF